MTGGLGLVGVGRPEEIWLVLQAVRQRQAMRQTKSAGAMQEWDCRRGGCLK